MFMSFIVEKFSDGYTCRFMFNGQIYLIFDVSRITAIRKAVNYYKELQEKYATIR